MAGDWKLSVDIDEIAHVSGDDFKGKISAVLNHGDRPVQDKEVLLFVGGIPTGAAIKTDSNGRVADEFKIATAANTISIEAQEVGFPVRGRKDNINLPRPDKKPGEKKMKIVISGPSGKQKEFFLSIVTPEKKERVTINSSVPLKMVQHHPPQEPPESIEPSTHFNIESCDERNIFLKFEFKGSEANLTIGHLPSGEVHHRMLIK